MGQKDYSLHSFFHFVDLMMALEDGYVPYTPRAVYKLQSRKVSASCSRTSVTFQEDSFCHFLPDT